MVEWFIVSGNHSSMFVALFYRLHKEGVRFLEQCSSVSLQAWRLWLQSVRWRSDLFSKPSDKSPADRLNEQTIPDSFMVCCDCTLCNMTSESSVYFYLRLWELVSLSTAASKKICREVWFWAIWPLTLQSCRHDALPLRQTLPPPPQTSHLRLTPCPILCKHLKISSVTCAKSGLPPLESAGCDPAQLVRGGGSNKMLSDLAPLEMSAPEPADARLSGVRSVPDSTATGSAAACKKQRTMRSTRRDKQQSWTAAWWRLLAPFPQIFCHMPSHSPPLLFKMHICSCPAAAVAQTDLCCPTALMCSGNDKARAWWWWCRQQQKPEHG